MKIQLERLPHQIKALQAINKDFYGVDTTTIILMLVIFMLTRF